MGSQPHRTDTHIHMWQIDKRNIGTCTHPLCGEVRQFPWNAKDPVIVLKRGNLSINQVSEKEGHMTISNKEKHQRYEDHKEEILVDLRSIGRPATREKWKIPSGTMTQLEIRWLTTQERKDLTLGSNAAKGTPKSRSVVVTSNNNLSPFPEFSNEWPESVQIKWFEIYEKLIGIQRSINQAGG